MPARPLFSRVKPRRLAAVLAAAGLCAGGLIAVPLLAGPANPAPAEPARTPLVAPKPAAMSDPAVTTAETASETDWSALTDAQWKARLTPEEYRVLRKHGTERAGTGTYAYSKDKGVYDCAACGLPLFDAAAKFESGTGWPSFYQPVDGVKSDHVGETVDRSWFMTRTEVHCDRCGGHLGHVFNDGPQPTGLRYCINSVSLKLDPDAKAEGDEQTDAGAKAK